MIENEKTPEELLQEEWNKKLSDAGFGMNRGKGKPSKTELAEIRLANRKIRLIDKKISAKRERRKQRKKQRLAERRNMNPC
jgi:hypothetical protein